MKISITPKDIIPVIEIDSLDLNLLKPEYDYIVSHIVEKRGRITFNLFDDDGDELGLYRTDTDYWNVDVGELV